MGLGMKCVLKVLDKVVPMSFLFGAVQLAAGDECAVETLGLSIRLQVVGCHDAFLDLRQVQSNEKNLISN